MISARNNDISTQLTNVDNLLLPGQALQVFCVSNHIWWKHRGNPEPFSQQWLELSGIIRLRQHCIGLVSSNQLRTAMSFIDNSLPTLLADVGSWVSTGAGTLSAEQRLRLCEILDQFELKLRTVCLRIEQGTPYVSSLY